MVPHQVFWGTRVQAADLSDVEPFRLAAEALADKVRDRGILMIMVAGVRVEGDDEFLILASYAGAPHAWWPVGADSLLGRKCPAGPRLVRLRRSGTEDRPRSARPPIESWR